MLADKLKNTIWSLISYQSEDKDGNIIYPLGDNAKGYITFTEKNILKVQLMALDRENIPPKDFIDNMNTETEQQMAKLGYHAYTGPFLLDEEAAILTTNVELSLIPEYIGSQQKRKATIEGNLLHLSNVAHPERKLVWKLVE